MSQLALFTSPGVRHDATESSRAAAEAVKRGHSRRLEQIAHVVALSRDRGCTAKDIVRWGQQQDGSTDCEGTWRGTFSRAKEAGLILPNGEKRDGCEVCVAPQYQGGTDDNH